MIKSKSDLKLYLREDMSFFYQFSKKERMICALTQDPLCQIVKYIKFLRKEEYYFNCRKDKIGRLLNLWYLRRKNKIGNRIGFKIPKNTFEEGLIIYHHGGIIINEDVKVGRNAVLHGNNCIGNNGSPGGKVPIIGDDLDLGIGAIILGDLQLGNNIRVGANAVVTKTCEEDNIVLKGVPANSRKIEQ